MKLIDKNKGGKYLKYAIGEILLVMIGILLALQVNNWNESKKIKAEELKMLLELKADLDYSIEELAIVEKTNESFAEQLIVIQMHIHENLPYSKVLDTAFGSLDTWGIPYLPFTAYESLKFKGIDLISNDSLKQQITKVYNFHIKRLIEDMGQWEWSYNQNTTQRIMTKNIRRGLWASGTSELAIPNDYEKLKKDDEFNNFLSVLIPIRKDHVHYLRSTKKAVIELSAAIKEEIENF